MMGMPDGKALVQEMAESLPLYCHVDKSTAKLLKQQGIVVSEKTPLEITDVRDMGEVGGISCVIKRPDSDAVLILSATQVRFPGKGALYDKINAYRTARSRWLR